MAAKSAAPEIILRRGRAQAKEERKGVLRQLIVVAGLVVMFFIGSTAYQGLGKYFADMSPTGRMLQGLPTFTPSAPAAAGGMVSSVSTSVVAARSPVAPAAVVTGTATLGPGVVRMPSPQTGGTVVPGAPGWYGGAPGYPHGTPTLGSSP